MRVSLFRVAVVCAALGMVPSLSAQSLRAFNGTQDSELLKDYFFEEHGDGSIVTADAFGTYVFRDFTEYIGSSFFVDHGLRCGNERLPQFMSLGAPSDCNSSNTNPAVEYDPAGGVLWDIPVWVHVLRRTSGQGNITDPTIASQITVLNEDFQALAGSLGAPGTNVRIKFHLAGVTRSNNNNWYNDRGTYYNSLARDVRTNLNIYTNTASGNLGYAYVPSGGGVVGNTFDRVVIYWPAFGKPGSYGAPYNLGRTVTHEVGHYLGLYHTFQGGCASPAGCATNGDLICDTLPESTPNFSPCTRSTCGDPDPTSNYMDYSDDVCMNNFSANQARRMRCTMANFRTLLAR